MVPIRKLILLACLATPSFAAISATMQWDVRTTGSDSNGGGYDPAVASPGTDFSQQDSAQQAYTDLVIDGTTNTKVTSAAHPFSSTSPGNVINITAGTGFTVQRVEILSVSGSTATCDKSLGTLSSTGGTGNMGGSLLTHATAFSPATQKNTIWTKSGTYTTTSVTSSNSGNAFSWIGYGSTHGDNGTKPLITTATNSTTLFQIGSVNNGTAIGVFIHNLSFSNTAGTSASGIINNDSSSATYITISNCDFTGFTDALAYAGGVNGQSPGALICTECSFTANTSRAINAGAILTLVRNSYIYGNGTGTSCTNLGQIYATVTTDTVIVIDKSIVSGGTNCGIHLKSTGVWSLQVTNSTIANNGTDGIRLANSSGVVNGPVAFVESTILYGNGGWGMNVDSTIPTGRTFIRNNGVGSNTSGNYTGVSSISGDVSIGSNPFVSSTNFALSGAGGASLKALGYPGAFAGGTTTSYLDIGAVQSQAATVTTKSVGVAE